MRNELLNISEQKSRGNSGQFRRPVRIDVLLAACYQKIVEMRLARLDKEIFSEPL